MFMIIRINKMFSSAGCYRIEAMGYTEKDTALADVKNHDKSEDFIVVSYFINPT